MMQLPHPEVLADLRRLYPRIERDDLIASWQNASRHWIGLDPQYRIAEPAELTASRALFVRSLFEEFAEDRQTFIYCMWQLVTPYCSKK